MTQTIDQLTQKLTQIPVAQEGYVGNVECSPSRAQVGEKVTITGKQLPKESTLQLVWDSYTVNWDIERNHQGVPWKKFQGINFEPRQVVLAEVTTDQEGDFTYQLKVPQDFGGVHDIYLIKDEKRINKVGLRIDPSFSVQPTHGPPGSPISIRAEGLPVEDMLENPPYHVYYDNKYTGFINPVTKRGATRFEIPAVGTPGPHLIDIEMGQFANGHSFRQTHIGLQSSPGATDLSWVFEVTDKEPVLPEPIENQTPSIMYREKVFRNMESNPGPILTAKEEAIPVGSPVTVQGKGFPPGSTIELTWCDLEGNDLMDIGYNVRTTIKSKVEADNHGRIEKKLNPAPRSVQGGPHPIHALADGEILATTYTIVLPRLRPLEVKEGGVGTELTLKGTGLGWGDVWKDVLFVYDNSYIGYSCGGDIPGIMDAKIKASGDPGWHFIDLYPTIAKNRRIAEEAFEVPFIYRLPFLNWKTHPHGFHFRYGFKVTK